MALIASRSVSMQVERSLQSHLRLEGKTLAFTTPSPYASRLDLLLSQEGASTLACPSISVETTPQNHQSVRDRLCRSSPPHFSGIAFTSRAGILAVAKVLQENPHILRDTSIPWLSEDGFFVAALGRDAELLYELDLFGESKKHVRVVVPSIATPQAMAEELGDGRGRCILCPVPFVEDLEEPPVVPNFLRALSEKGWQPERLNAYTTKWVSPECAKPLLPLQKLDALVFTSSAEVEGLLKSLKVLGIDIETVKNATKPILAAHGPVTAAGAARLGITIDIVSKNFHSFDGIVEALDLYWKSCHERGN